MLLVVLLENADPLVEGRAGSDAGSNNGAKFMGVFGLVGTSIGDACDGVEGNENERAFVLGRGTSVGSGGERGGAGGDDGRRGGGREKRRSRKESRVE